MATEAYKVLGQSDPLAATLTDAYTVPASTEAVVSTIMIANRSTVKTQFRISVAVAGAASVNKQFIAFDVDITGNNMQEVTVGITLGAGDVVRVFATLATVSFNIFGTEIT